MTGIERLKAVFCGEGPDRPAAYAWITNDALPVHVTGEVFTESNRERVMLETWARCLDVTRVPDGYGLGPDFHPRTQRDALGYVRRYERWTDWIVEYPYQDQTGFYGVLEGDIERFRAWTPGAAGQREEDRRRWEAALGGATVVAGRVTVGTAPGPYFRDGLENFSYLVADRPELLATWVQARHEMNLRKIADCADPQACPVEFLDSDIAYKTSTLVSPQYFKETGWFARVAELVDAYHAAGVWAVFHSDGDLRPILNDLAATGIDGLNPIETAAGMTLPDVRRLVGPRVVLVGGMDNHLLMSGPAEKVRSRVCQHLREPGSAARLILGSSTEELDESMPLEHQLAFLEAVRTATQ